MTPARPQTLDIGRRLGELFLEEGRFEEAEQQFRHVLEIQRRVLKDSHPSTEYTMEWFLQAVLYHRSSTNSKLAVKVGQHLTGRHPNCPSAWTRLAWAYYRDGSWQSCLDALHTAEQLETTKRDKTEPGTDTNFFGKETIVPMRRMAAWQLGDHRQPDVDWQNRRHRSPHSTMLRFCQDELEHLLLGLGPEYSRTESRARIRMRQQRYREAAELLEGMAETEQAVLGEMNSVTVRTLYDAALAWRKADCPSQAHDSFARALNVFLNLDGVDRLTAASRIVEATEEIGLVPFDAVRPPAADEVPRRKDVLGYLETLPDDPQMKLYRLALAERILQRFPLINEAGWQLDRVIGLRGIVSPRYHAGEDAIYVSRQSSGFGTAQQNGVFRIDRDGHCQKVVPGHDVKGIGVDPQSGDVFYCEEGCGAILRLSKQETGRRTWVSTIRKGDSDPTAIAFPPRDYAGKHLLRGEGVFVDYGFGSPNGVYRFSCTKPGGCELIYGDESLHGPMYFPKDVSVGCDSIFVAFYMPSDNGYQGEGSGILRIGPDGRPVRVHLDRDIRDVHGMVRDPATSELLLFYSDAVHRKNLVRVDPATGHCRDVISDIPCESWMNAALDISPDGNKIVLATPNTVLVFSRNTTPEKLAHAAEAEAHRQCAANHVANRRWNEAIDELTKASELWPDTVNSWELQARARLAVGDVDGFDKVVRQVAQQLHRGAQLSVDAVLPLAWLWQHLTLLNDNRDWKEASLSLHNDVIQCLETLNKTSPCRQVRAALPACYWARVMRLHELGRHAEAVSDCERAVAVASANPWFWRYLAIACLMANEPDRYDAICHEMLDRFTDTTNQDFRSIVVECCTVVPPPAEFAEQILECAGELRASADPVHQSAYARALLRANRPQEAVDVFSKIVSTWEQDDASWNCWGDWFLLAEAYHRLGRSKQAELSLRDGINWTMRHQQYAADNFVGIDPQTRFRWRLFRQDAETSLDIKSQSEQQSKTQN